VKSNETSLVNRLLPLVGKNTHVLAPWSRDFRPDHEACGRAAEEVANRTGARLAFYFFWTWHRGAVALLECLKLRSFPLDLMQRQIKVEALMCHRSQLVHDSGEPILPENLLGPARRPVEVFLVS
jgi:LmbE family N-acetylglucosaminyl deacetylase